MVKVMAITLDMTRDIAPEFEITVCIVGMRKWQLRLWMAKQFIKLASMVSNMNVKFEKKPWYGADL